MQSKVKRFIFGPLSRYGISHKLQATALWSMLESFSGPLFSLLLIPIFTHNLGLENYGLYVLVMAFVSFFSFTGLGMNTSITYYLAVNYETLNPKQIAERLGSAISISLIGTLLFSCIFLLVILQLSSTLKIFYPQLIAQKQLIYIALGLVIITQLDMVVSSSLKGLQQFRISSQIEFVLRLLNFIAIALITVTQKNVTGIIIITFAMTLLNLIIRYQTFSKALNFHLTDIKINKESAKILFHFGKWMTLQNIAAVCFGSIDKIIIGTVLGSKVLGVYNVLISISQLAHYVPANMLTFLMPKVAKDNKNISISILYKSFVVVVFISLFIATLLISLKEPIFSNFKISSSYTSLYYWLVTSYVLLSLNIPSYFIGLGLNLIKVVSLQCLAGSLIGVFSLVILITSYGLFGAIVSKLIYSLIAIFLFIPVQKNIRLARE